MLCDSREIFLDGTFSVPNQFYQLFSLHAYMNEKQLPLIFCFMGGKSIEDYVRVFRALRDAMATIGKIWDPKVLCSEIIKILYLINLYLK